MALGDKVAQRRGLPPPLDRIVGGVYDDQLHFHFIGQNALDIYAGPLSGPDALTELGQPGQVGGQFDKNAVILH